MNTHSKIVAFGIAALVAAGNLQAQEATPENWAEPVQSVRVRADVLAEVALSSAAGNGRSRSQEQSEFSDPASVRTRAEVLAELAEASALDGFDMINAEAASFPSVPRRTLYAVRSER